MTAARTRERPPADESRRSLSTGRNRRKRAVDRDVYDLARERLRRTFDMFDTVAVSFSGGKDSTACLNMTLEIARDLGKLPVLTFFYDEEAIPYQTEEYVRRVAAVDGIDLRWLCVPIKHRNACSRRHPWWWPWAPEDEDKWVRPMPPEAITELDGFPAERDRRPSMPESVGLLLPPEKYGRVGMVMGIRAQESLTRLRAVLARNADNTWIRVFTEGYARGNLWKVYPIYDWMTEDVWTAPKRLGWDYNCNPYEAPIWMADLTFKPIGEVSPGDHVVGWRGGSSGRASLCETEVTATHRRLAQLVEVRLESGAVLRCTADHLWQVNTGERGNWEFAVANVGLNMAKVISLSPELPEGGYWYAAWLGGMYDGEGSYSRIYQHERDNGVYLAVREALGRVGIPFTEMNRRSAAQHGFSLRGGRQGLVNFVNLCRPVKREQIKSMVLTHRFRTKDRVVSIEPLPGVHPVYALTTETENYVCWGYASRNSAYDAMDKAGITPLNQRCAPPYGEEPMRSLWMFAECFPEIWPRMQERVPGAATGARYSETQLYAFGSVPEKPPGVKWTDFIRSWIEKHPPQYRAQVAERVRGHIRMHYSKTTEPIAARHAHPVTGVSWKFLLNIAIRGDYKNRRNPSRVGDPEAARKKYDAEIAAMRAEGEL